MFFFINGICTYHASLTVIFSHLGVSKVPIGLRDGRDSNRMVVRYTTTYAISAYQHWCCEFESRSGRGVQH